MLGKAVILKMWPFYDQNNPSQQQMIKITMILSGVNFCRTKKQYICVKTSDLYVILTNLYTSTLHIILCINVLESHAHSVLKCYCPLPLRVNDCV